MAAFCGRSMSLVPDDDGGLAPSFRERGGVSGIYPSMPPSNLEETPPYKSESHRWDPIEAGRPVSTVVLFMYTPKRHVAVCAGVTRSDVAV